jgi:uncharacterized protein
MIIEFALEDGVLEQPAYLKDEAAYNLLHLITESKQALRLTSRRRKIIFAQTPGHNAWLWLAEQASDIERERLLQQLVDYLVKQDVVLPGVTGTSRTVELFAARYCAARQLTYETHMGMESYCCPNEPYRPNVAGRLRVSNRQDAHVIAEFLAGFQEDALGTPSAASSHLAAAEWMCSSGKLYVWVIEDEIVSMANLAHRSRRYGRINSVYTPRPHRKQGYASAIVSAICSILHSEKLIPLLYADQQNPDSNRVYRNVGFLPSGVVNDVRFVD